MTSVSRGGDRAANFLAHANKAVSARQAFDVVASGYGDNSSAQDMLDSIHKVLPVRKSIGLEREGVSAINNTGWHIAVALTVKRIQSARQAIASLSETDRALLAGNMASNAPDVFKHIKELAMVTPTDQQYLQDADSVARAVSLYKDVGVSDEVIQELIANPDPVL